MAKKSLLRGPKFRWQSWLIAAAIAAVALFGALSIDLEGVYADEYEGTVYFNLSDDGMPVVAKVNQSMTVKAKTKTVKAAKLKKAKQTVKGTITVKNAKGTVTYAKKSGSAKLTISKKGVVTVRKGTKKGTYKIKVNVKAAGNVNYKAAAKVVTVTVKVR